jgi:hypothetical protein
MSLLPLQEGWQFTSSLKLIPIPLSKHGHLKAQDETGCFPVFFRTVALSIRHWDSENPKEGVPLRQFSRDEVFGKMKS